MFWSGVWVVLTSKQFALVQRGFFASKSHKFHHIDDHQYRLRLGEEALVGSKTLKSILHENSFLYGLKDAFMVFVTEKCAIPESTGGDISPAKFISN